MICPLCECDWWNEHCLNCHINIFEYENNPSYKKEVDEERTPKTKKEESML